MLSSEPVFTLQQPEETIHDASASPSSGEQIIFDRFREMNKNELLNISTNTEFWKFNYTNQTIMLSALDHDIEQFQLASIEPTITAPKTTEDYKYSLFSFDTKQIHPIDQINLHKQAGDMIYSSLTSSTMVASKLQASFNNIHFQLKLENMSSLEKDTRIKGLEYLVLKLGLYPNDIDAAKEIIRNGYLDIQAL